MASRSRAARARRISRSPSGRRRSFRRSAATRAGRARFGRELNATDDRDAFRGPAGTACRSSKASRSSRSAWTLRDSRWTHPRRRRAAPAAGPAATRTPRLAYRDVASATNRLTLIAARAAGRLRLDAHGLLPAHAAASARPALPLRAVQQLRRELPGPAARHHARDDGDRRAAAGPDPRPRPRGGARDRRAGARVLSRRHDPAAHARLQARRRRAVSADAPRSSTHVLSTFPLVPREQRDAAAGDVSAGTSQRLTKTRRPR